MKPILIILLTLIGYGASAQAISDSVTKYRRLLHSCVDLSNKTKDTIQQKKLYYAAEHFWRPNYDRYMEMEADSVIAENKRKRLKQ